MTTAHAENPLAKLPRFVKVPGADKPDQKPEFVRASVVGSVDKKAGTVRLAHGETIEQAVPDELSEPGDAVLVTDEKGGGGKIVSRHDFGVQYRDPTSAEVEAHDHPPDDEHKKHASAKAEAGGPGSAGAAPQNAHTTVKK